MSAEAARLVQVVSNAQIDAGIRGNVGEIGIHHGRSFILLYLLARPDEHAFAIDLFDAQELNVDRSGAGNVGIFLSHLRRVGADIRRIHILATSSLAVSPSQLHELAGPVRLFSIDGGHATAVALSDLVLAEAALVDGGVVILDDVFTSIFPGVSAALATFLHNSAGLVPFAISPEKVLLCQPQHHDRFAAAVAAGMSGLVLRSETYFGSNVVIIRAHPNATETLQLGIANTNVYRWLRCRPMIGRVLERLRPAVLRTLGR